MKIRFIGDVHGKWSTYKKRIKDVQTSIQLGDFGVGFYHPYTSKIQGGNPPYSNMAKGDHRFIRGNHDNPNVCKTHPFWIPDGTLVHDKIFCIGGAMSIDKHMRTEGYDWWADEELTYSQFMKVLDEYERLKPSVVVAHEVPESIAMRVMPKLDSYKYDMPSITRQFLDNMMHVHKPDLLIHGHWHVNYHTVIDGVEYIGLGELNFLDLDI